MKKAVSSFLAASALLVAPGALPHFASAFAQAAAGGQIQMDPAEYTDYDNAVNKQTTPQTQAPALEAYLAKYPKSSVKQDVLQRLMVDYSQIPDAAKAISTADQILQLDPNNLTADIVETVFRAQQGKLDEAAAYAEKGLATTKPANVKQEDFDKQKNGAIPTFQSTIGNAALAKKDYPTAITAFKAELAAVPPTATQTVGVPLQDTYNLGQAYYASTPPDYVNCTFYTTRAAQFAPDPYKTQFQQLATYCYKKYHGGADGYDAVIAAAKANLNPPSDFTIKPAPTPADQAAALMSSTKDADLPTLAITDKEFVLQYGKPEDADKLFNALKGKGEKLTDATVISATGDQLQLSLGDDAVQAKTADFTITMKTPFKTPPAAGTKVTVIGVWSAYTQNPFMITMTDGEEVKKAAPAAKKPAARRR
jgi:tetratricopeptide (TPR) repeat protein